ncbi:MAG TPA: hypothetical protein EYP85_04390 [Armatimonadetes bacterium]|nr:hypothetical protein [Armatimonadota bacterium]
MTPSSQVIISSGGGTPLKTICWNRILFGKRQSTYYRELAGSLIRLQGFRNLLLRQLKDRVPEDVQFIVKRQILRLPEDS